MISDTFLFRSIGHDERNRNLDLIKVVALFKTSTRELYDLTEFLYYTNCKFYQNVENEKIEVTRKISNRENV